MAQINKNDFKRTIRVSYPAGTGTLVIRTELDWERDVSPVALSSDGNTATFEIEAHQRFVHFKPCLIKNGSVHWAVGPDNLLMMGPARMRVRIIRTSSAIHADGSRPSSKLNPRYLEETIGCEFTCRLVMTKNTTARYPLAYMQDGQNLFFQRNHSTRGLADRRNQPVTAGHASHRRLDHCRRLFE
jgi:hypothetical protein